MSRTDRASIDHIFGKSGKERADAILLAKRYKDHDNYWRAVPLLSHTLIYEHLRDHDNLIDAIVNYCVSCFLQHHLAEDPEFQQLAYELRPFHQALCKNSLDRGFQNDSKCFSQPCEIF